MKHLLLLLILCWAQPLFAQKDSMMVRMAELEIHEQYLSEYKQILKEESSASLQVEPGVICIYPMSQKEHPTQIRLLEIYASRHAYESHIKSAHFLKYKSSTQHMVKELRLIDMLALDAQSMHLLFRKMKD